MLRLVMYSIYHNCCKLPASICSKQVKMYKMETRLRSEKEYFV